MLIYLISLLVVLIVHGPEQYFIAPDLIKEVREHIQDDDRKKKIIYLLEDGKHQIKEFRDREDEYGKQVRKELRQDSVSKEKIKTIFDIYFEDRKQLQKALIEYRLQMQDLITDEEWTNVIQPAVYPSEKDSLASIKSSKKALEETQKTFGKLEERIKEEIVDENKKESCLNAFKEFEESFLELMNFVIDLNYKNYEVLQDRQASREELKAFYDQQDKLRAELYPAITKMIEVIHTESSETEWNKIKPDLISIIED